MGKTYIKSINRFDGGMVNDRRDKNSNRYALASHFDAKTYTHKLVPQSGSVARDTDITNAKIVKFAYENRSGTYRLFGFGENTGAATYAKVWYWDGSAWQEPANAYSSSGARNEEVFFGYKGYLYMWSSGTVIMRFDCDSGDAFNESYQSISYTNVAQPVLHQADDVAYFFSDNRVHSLDNTTWSTDVLVLPATLKITSACAYGNYLAIGCTTLKDGNKQSVVYLWDRDSSLTTVSERIDFGEGEIYHLANLSGRLTAVMINDLDLIIRQRNGEFCKTINQITSTATSIIAPKRTNQLINNILYFPLDLDQDGGDRCGIWALDEYGRMNIEYVIDGASIYQGIFNLNGLWWVAHGNSGNISQESDTNNIFSKYETNLLEEAVQEKKLVKVGVTFEPVVLNSNIILKYRLKESDSYTTIFDFDVDNVSKAGVVIYEAINIESTGETLPEFREIQFMIEAKKASITGLVYTYEEIDTNL
jgi:hypothetical protein